MIRLLLFASLVSFCACKPKAPDSETERAPTCAEQKDATHRVRIVGRFGGKARAIQPSEQPPILIDLPVPALESLNADRADVICSVLIRRGIRHGVAQTLPELRVNIARPDDGLSLVVNKGGESRERRIPPAEGAAELRTNFEHTFDSVLSDFD